MNDGHSTENQLYDWNEITNNKLPETDIRKMYGCVINSINVTCGGHDGFYLKDSRYC